MRLTPPHKVAGLEVATVGSRVATGDWDGFAVGILTLRFVKLDGVSPTALPFSFVTSGLPTTRPETRSSLRDLPDALRGWEV